MNKKLFDEPRDLNDVAQFHETFELPIQDQPIIPTEDRCELRLNLIEEELKELKEAIDNKDLTEVADAFCDLQYVLSGAILEFGLGEMFSELFAEVQRSNLSKTCKTLEEAEATQDFYAMTKNTASIIEKKDDVYLVFRATDRKVLKSVNYSPADIKNILLSRSQKEKTETV